MGKLSSSLGLFLVTIVTVASILLPISFTVTWSGENRLTTYPNVDSMPSIAQTYDGKIWIVWERQAASSLAIFYTTSSNYGISWTPEKNITKVPSSDANIDPSIAQFSNGTILVVWASNRPPPSEPDFVLSADPSSLTIPQGSSNTSTITVTSTGGFSDPVDLSVKTIVPFSPDIDTDFHPTPVTPPLNGAATSTLSITVGALTTPGDYTIIVNGHSASLNKTKTVNVALTVTAAAGSSTFSSGHTAPEFISPSQTHDYEIYYKASHDNGASWSTAVRLTHDSADDKGPVVMQAANGTIWLVWSSSRTGNYEIWYKTSSDMGASWSNATPLTSDAAVDAFPAIAQMSDDRIWVAWHSGRYLNNGGIEILYDIYDGAAWAGVERLTDTSKDVDDTCPGILQTTNGTIWLFWASEGGTQPPFILYTQSADNGNTWSPPLEFTTGLSLDKYPATTQTIDTRIWVVWASLRDENWEIYYRYSSEDVIHDVAIANVAPATSTAKQGDFVSITVVAENQGSGEESFVVSCYADLTLIGSENVNSLDAGSSTERYLTWNTTAFAAGVYVISATASGIEGEADIDDNTFTDGTVELTAPIHDVAVIDVTPASNVVLQGDTIRVDVTTQNQGTDAETFDVTCKVNSTSIGSQTITVDPANSSVLTFTWSTSSYAVGNYTISATANAVPDEEDTDDNVFVDGIVEVVTQPLHDIAVTGVTPSPTSVVKGQLVYVAVIVKNEGTEAETFNVTAMYDDTEIGTQLVSSLAAGNATTKTFTWNTTGVSAGDYTIKAVAEVVEGEVDTPDNTFVGGGITILPYRDIAVSDVTAYPTEVVKPGSVLINVTVANEGEVGETFNVTVYYDWIEIDPSYIGVSVEAGANTTLTFTWDTTAVDASTYTISAKVSVVPYETDIDDNIFTNGDVIVTRPPGVPVASFTWTPSEPLVNEVIAFNASASYDQDGGTIERYYWDFGDGTNGTDIVVSHTYMVTGQYRVALTVEDNEGNTDSVLHIVAVYTRDVAIVNVAAYPPKVMVGELVFIDVTVVNEGGLSETFNVTAHYNATQIGSQTVTLVPAGANVTLTFVWNTTSLAVGKYVLQVYASPVPGETDITDNSYTNGQITLTMFPLAVFTYTPSAPLVGEAIAFDATESQPNGGAITQYRWAFGDNKTGWGKIVKYSYSTTGTYIVRLTITDSEGLIDFMEKAVVVHTAPIALFTYTPSFPKAGEPITFNASASSNPEGSAIVSYDWNFGDNSTGTGITSIHTYENPGNYTVTLTVQDIVGREDTEAMTIMVNEATISPSHWPLEVLVIVTMVIIVGVTLTALFFRKRKSNVK